MSETKTYVFPESGNNGGGGMGQRRGVRGTGRYSRYR
jgi:hypothetical protein